MAYKQVKAFNKSKAGKTPGSCLMNTRTGFGIASKYPNAWQAWLNTQQHTGQPPQGIDVPIFFWYKDAKNGHIGVRLANGQFWSDGDLYASIADYEAVKQPNYVGWGESINGVKVIEQVADPAPTPTTSTYGLPAVGSRIKLRKGVTRTVFDEKGNVLGSIYAADESYEYTVRYHHNNRIGINSAKFGRQVEFACYYLTGARTDGWAQI
jgi:hypothetical protein